MIIKAIVVPTPNRIKKKFKESITKDEIFLYSLILGGIGVISLSDIEFKGLPIFGLTYCGLAYSFLRNVDEEILKEIFKNYYLIGRL
ncbi:hypothetical protein HMPREF1092_00857 [Clostridium thermobutyricum]|jgi:hypothetical protein|uniref:Uncharacterized protein n=1 Tax=Clostridium thermobutyricum TaxID=29372 RepID=N9XPI8_9CLOT|nr:hypothetical protein [Clostridium thermobutyricum]ENZ01623.1 hypothetical protein HMPREF1092_00857 [Clostridium thermobutyricum]